MDPTGQPYHGEHLLKLVPAINIRERYRCTNVYRKSGVYWTNLIGDLVSYHEPIWYNIKKITNLSMDMVDKNLVVTYGKEQIFIVERAT